MKRRCCTVVAKALPVKINPLLKTDRLWSRLHIDSLGPMNGIYLVVVDSFTKWPEVVKCRKPTCKSAIKFLQGLVFQISDNKMQFTAKEFEDFCKEFSISHVTAASFHPRSNGQAEHFIDMFKWTFKKSRWSWSLRRIITISQSVSDNSKLKYNFRIVTNWTYVC